MKRSLLLATAATLVSGAALAQSSVTVYGRFNTSVERQTDFDGVKGSVYREANNGSRLGFRGTEDLGGGLKANFVLEHRFNSDTGAATNGAAGFWGGAGSSEVNISSDAVGTIRLGHFTSEAYFATSDVTDLLNHGTGTSADAFYRYLGNDSNRISYKSPALGPVTAELGVSLGEGAPNKRLTDLAVNFGAGPFGAGLGYQKETNGDSQFAIRANATFDPITVTGYVQRAKFDTESAAAGVDTKTQTIWRVSAMYAIGAAELHLAYGHKSDITPVDVAAKQFTVGANYNLSKRTKVFAYWNKITVDGPTLDPSTLALGIRHNF
jgi:predicted porin